MYCSNSIYYYYCNCYYCLHYYHDYFNYRTARHISLFARTNAPTGRVDRNWTKSGGKAP